MEAIEGRHAEVSGRFSWRNRGTEENAVKIINMIKLGAEQNGE